MNSINEYFEYLFKLERSGIKYNLKNIKLLLESMGNPHLNFRSIHIAGTNGKGGTASFAASILTESGIKTGLFTSPHILRFNERIRINGKCITDSYIKSFLNKFEKLIREIKPSFFEVNTAIAFKYFSDNKIDAAVVECGLGGKLDSTNVLKPDVSVITQIGLDHKIFLGNTLRKIAIEKLGIVKKDTLVIISDNNHRLIHLFKTNISPKYLLYMDSVCRIKITKQQYNRIQFNLIHNGVQNSYTIPLPGIFQARNASAAIIAVEEFFRINPLTVKQHCYTKGIKNVISNSGYFGRLQSIKLNGCKYIIDVSHNPEGIKESLNSLKPLKPGAIIFGIMEDKEYKKALREILKSEGTVIFTRPDYSRSLNPEILYKAALKIKNGSEYYTAKNAEEAINILKGFSKKPKTVLITGSFFLISDVIKILKLEKHFSV